MPRRGAISTHIHRTDALLPTSPPLLPHKLGRRSRAPQANSVRMWCTTTLSILPSLCACPTPHKLEQRSRAPQANSVRMWCTATLFILRVSIRARPSRNEWYLIKHVFCGILFSWFVTYLIVAHSRAPTSPNFTPLSRWRGRKFPRRFGLRTARPTPAFAPDAPCSLDTPLYAPRTAI